MLIFSFSQFGSSSDLVAGMGPESRRSIAGTAATSGVSGGPYGYGNFLQQRDDSGIYGSATSLPSNKMQDSPNQQGSPVMQHGRGPGGGNSSGNLGAGASGGPPFTPDFHGARARPHTVIALDQQSIRSQPAQPIGDQYRPGSGAVNDRQSSYIPLRVRIVFIKSELIHTTEGEDCVY